MLHHSAFLPKPEAQAAEEPEMVNEEFDGQCCRTYPYNHKRIRIWQADKQKKRKAEDEKAAREAAAARSSSQMMMMTPEPEKEKRIKTEHYHQQQQFLQQQQHSSSSRGDLCATAAAAGKPGISGQEKSCKVESNVTGKYNE